MLSRLVDKMRDIIDLKTPSAPETGAQTAAAPEAASENALRAEIAAGAAIADSKITDIDSQNPVDRADIIGNRVPFAANYNINAGAQLTQPVSTDVDFVARVDYSRTGSVWYDQRNQPNTKRDPIDLVNARIGFASDRWELAVWSKNLFDKDYNADAVVILPVAHAVFRAPDRSFGVEGKVKF